MPRTFRWILPLSLLTLAACGHSNTPAATTDGAPAAQTSTPAAATSASTTATDNDSGSDFVMSMDKLDAYMATIRKAATMMAAHAGDADDDDNDPLAMDGAESVDQYITRINADPQAKAMVTSAGMSVSDYAHTNEAVLEGMMTAGALKSGALKKIPDGINPQYVQFAQEHETEINAKMAEMKKSGSGG